ncbi:MAG: Rho termination factor N-terminal domain-containing protein [Paeniclostridium sordellii]|nr:Rho termination factor N-terminal domain-containing protein [Paeniclostridium sordellii]
MDIITDLNELNVQELKEICKKRGFSGYSNLNKNELIDLINKQKK